MESASELGLTLWTFIWALHRINLNVMVQDFFFFNSQKYLKNLKYQKATTPKKPIKTKFNAILASIQYRSSPRPLPSTVF